MRCLYGWILALMLTVTAAGCSDANGRAEIEPDATAVSSSQTIATSPQAPAPSVGPLPSSAPARSGSSTPNAEKGPHISDWLEPDQRESYDFSYEVTDQDKRNYPMTELLGRPTAMSFIFTRCPNVNMCPATAVAMAALERQLAQAGLADQVNLVMVTYDPKYDTPELLRAFGERYGVQFTAVRLLRTRIQDFDAFLYDYQIAARFLGEGVIDHYVDLYLFDKQGRVARFYSSGVWDNEQALADLKKLAAEPTPSTDPPPNANVEN